MKTKLFPAVALAILLVLSFQNPGQAKIHQCDFNVWTTQYPGQQLRIDFDARIADSKLRPPDAVKSLKVYAPDGTVFDMTDNRWQEWNGIFWAGYYATDFAGGVIPPGKYTMAVEDNGGHKIINHEFLHERALDPLAPATLINPAPPPAPVPVLPLDTTFKWEKVPGAKFYRIHLFNEYWKEPVYYQSARHPAFVVYQNCLAVPKGVLIPNCGYSLRIEARDNEKNMNRRSRTSWIPFKTAP